jgi:uncharacterized membrane protein
MAMRLQELHPALVHFPITMLPVSLATDAIGRATGNRSLLDAGRVGVALAAFGAGVSAVTGLLAQESSEFDPTARDMLVTHRTLNLGLIGLTTLMAARRARRKQPSLRYLTAGLAGLGVMTYSAYLGGRMVYGHGVGVEVASRAREGDSPPLVPGHLREAVQVSGRHVASGLKDVIGTAARGELLPTLTRGHAGAD